MTSKESLRADVRRSRAGRSAAQLTEVEEMLARRTLELPEVASAGVVAMYLSLGDEPPTWTLAEALRERGTTVFAPVMARRRELDWAEFVGRDALRTAAYGISEPTGPRLGAAVLGGAGAVLVPALAVDRQGRRLGRGAGYYDRALAHADRNATRAALVFDDELVDEVPTEPHDEPVHVIVSPDRTVRCTPG